jgi:hypothetical protein
MPDKYEVLDPLPIQPRESKWKKYGPFIFWGTMVALPAMNLGSSYFDYKTAKIQLEIARLQEAAESVQ